MPDDRYAAEHAALGELAALSNWGRWGADDQRGALNTVTPDVVRGAAALVRTGRVIALGEPIGGAAPAFSATPRPQRFVTGASVAERYGEPAQTATDGVVLGAIHGAVTHVDALCHVGTARGLYNGVPNATVGVAGAGRLGIEHVGGIVTRGVLIDVAGLRGVAALDATDIVTADDVAAAEAATGVTVAAGDAVLIRTGWRARYAEDPQAWGELQPGIGPSAALYLAQRDVCLIGADNLSVEAHSIGGGVARDPRPVANRLHPRLIGDLGIYLLELLVLDELAAAGAAAFQFCLAPLRVMGATTSPVNPLAVV